MYIWRVWSTGHLFCHEVCGLSSSRSSGSLLSVALLRLSPVCNKMNNTVMKLYSAPYNTNNTVMKPVINRNTPLKSYQLSRNDKRRQIQHWVKYYCPRLWVWTCMPGFHMIFWISNWWPYHNVCVKVFSYHWYAIWLVSEFKFWWVTTCKVGIRMCDSAVSQLKVSFT